jgi:hypothetical protein
MIHVNITYVVSHQQSGKVSHMLKRFLKAMEYRSYCMGIRELRNLGMFDKADEVSEFKKKMYKTN